MIKLTCRLFCICVLFAWASCTCNKSKETVSDYTEASKRVYEGMYCIKEQQISPSPQGPKSIELKSGEKMLSFSVSPNSAAVAALVADGKKYDVRFWNAADADFLGKIDIEEGWEPSELAYHPEGNCLFVAGVKDGQSEILKLTKNGSSWGRSVIYTTKSKLKNLLVCPRPFLVEYDQKTSKSLYAYRLFFGESTKKDRYRIMSVTEDGKIAYQAAGPKESMTVIKDAEEPSALVLDDALPVAFYPSGNILVFKDRNDNLFNASYGRSWDSRTVSLKEYATIHKGSIAIAPNELAWLHWTPQKAGVGVYVLPTKQYAVQASGCLFASQPQATPDGKGALGVCQNAGKYSLHYQPLNIPLADVVNASLFIDKKAEFDLFVKNDGMFVPQSYDQLYELYDSENYYAADAQTRPYLITTDIFWEMFGAAYEGMFILKERNESMPKFWSFVEKAQNYFEHSKPDSKWNSVFRSLMNLKEKKNEDIEVKRMLAEENDFCELIDTVFNYAELKVRGHYTAVEEMSTYFKAFKYFTTIFKQRQKWLPELNSLPQAAKNDAMDWIKSYKGFIASSRAPLVWDGLSNEVPIYCVHPDKKTSLFPLSWGFDNEVLFSTVYHKNFPPEWTIENSRKEGRDIPSGLDLVASLGNAFADELLQEEYKEYPVLKNVIGKLKANFKKNGICKDDNLYGKWLNALAVQWCDTVKSANGDAKQKIWQTKRIQTGLASWATLRHATCLVNERSMAESGEGGFEEMVARAPRGYVEPDPQTFEAIADLFETMVKHIPSDIKKLNDVKDEEGGPDKKSFSDLYDGITTRLKNAAKETREFKAMAEKQKKGIPLTDKEYEKITFVGGVAEHYFLIFKSLANKDLALSKPDPMPKVIDVAGVPGTTYSAAAFLLSAVGRPFEWDYVVPFFGRHQLVKGSIYSYYEFTSTSLMNDKEWNTALYKQPFLPWIKPFVLPVDFKAKAQDE